MNEAGSLQWAMCKRQGDGKAGVGGGGGGYCEHCARRYLCHGLLEACGGDWQQGYGQHGEWRTE